MTTDRIPLPWDKPPLMANDSMHWTRRRRIIAEVRGTALVLARHHRIPPRDRAVVTLHWLPAQNRRRDDSGPAPTVKAAVDGLVDAGVFRDDTHDIVQHRVVIHPADRDATERLWLTIEDFPALFAELTAPRRAQT